MPRFAANLSLLYTEHAVLDRYEAAARDGFEAVECLFPYAHDSADLARRLAGHRLQQVLINAPPGDWGKGERGIACLPGREEEFRAGVLMALAYAEALACPRVHVMAGCAAGGDDHGSPRRTYVANLGWAARQAAGRGVEVLIEPINPCVFPGYFLNRQQDAHTVLAEVGEPNLKVQLDLYHCRLVEGDVLNTLRRYLPTGKVGHLQIAGVPDRNEPDRGELDLDALFGLIDALGYDGWIGCEYRPRGATSAGLGWLRRLARHGGKSG